MLQKSEDASQQLRHDLHTKTDLVKSYEQRVTSLHNDVTRLTQAVGEKQSRIEYVTRHNFEV